MRLIIAFVALLVVALSFPAQAQDKSAFSLDRLSIATGLDYAWTSSPNSSPALSPLQKKEWEVPLNLSYSLLSTAPNAISGPKPLLSLIAGTSWGTDSHIVKARVGLRLILFVGGK
jgi:hypothetical protein